MSRNINIFSNMLIKEREFWESKINEEFVKTIGPFKNYLENEDKVNESLCYTIKGDSFNIIKKVCKNSEEKIFMFLYSLVTVLAYKYTNNKYIIIESPIFKQNEEKAIVNSMIPLIQQISGSSTFKEILLNSKIIIEEAYENGNYPVNKIYDMVDDLHDIEESPLTDIVFLVDNLQEPSLLDDLNGRLNFIFSIQEESISLQIKCDIKVYSETAIGKIFEHISNILSCIVSNFDVEVDKIDILSSEEKEMILFDFNATNREYFKYLTIQELFEIQVKKTPNKVAVVFDDKEITYEQLNNKSNVLSKILREKGIKPNDIVGILIDRSEDMIVLMLAILKAGGAYLPMDPKYPIDRINFILEDSKAAVIVTERELKKDLNYNGTVINTEDILWEEHTDNLKNLNSSHDLAYVIYTSGSTAKPKGVMVEHRQVNNFIEGIIDKANIIKYDSILCITTISFDIFVLETLLPLTKGLKVSITKDGTDTDGDIISEMIEKNHIKIIQSTPFRMSVLLENARFRKSLEEVKVLLIGGDALQLSLVNKLRKYNLDIYNMYGPTETTVWSTLKKIENEDSISVGKPIQNTKVYILNDKLNLQPVGVIGEVYIGGDGLGRGYLNNEDLNKKAFIENPFDCNQRIYSTGDLGRWLQDGNIELLGRKDYQVKIRGFRIELGEIENRLLNIKGIKEVAVVAKGEMSNKYLCAYYESEIDYSISKLKEELKKHMPDYMVPTYLMRLENMPLTPNGKLDRKGLMKIKEEINDRAHYESPRNPMEEKMVKMFEEILGVKNIGINDDFFDQGGDSLSATILMGNICKEFNIEISIKEIFALTTIKGLSEYIRSKENSTFEGIDKTEEKEYYEASSAQERMYALQELDKESVVYNMPAAITLNEKLDLVKVKNILLKLIDRHEILRTKFEVKDGNIVQIVKESTDINLDIQELSIRDESEFDLALYSFRKKFDLSMVPLLRVGVIRIADTKEILVYDMHHIISDGVSMEILTKEFVALYKGKELESLKVQYKDYCNWQNKFKASEEYKKQESYWVKKFEGEIPVLTIPTDFSMPIIQQFSGANFRFNLDKDDTIRLRDLAKETGTTMYMVLLSIFKVLLAKYSGQDDIVVGTPISGRNHPDLENIIGMLVNTLPIRSRVDFEKNYLDFLNEIKVNTLEAYENQDYQFEELIQKVEVDRDLSKNPLFDVMFVFQNIKQAKIKVENLTFKPYILNNNVEKFNITMIVFEGIDDINFILSYSTSLYKHETIERMVNHFLNIVKEILNDTEVKIKDIELLGEDEKHKLLVDFNDTSADYPRYKTIHQLFQEQVEMTPDNIAVAFEDEELTYKDLNEKANQLAKKLKNKGVKADSIVGIMVERSLEMIIGIMGILKAGGAYLPIDSSYPKERIEYMLKHSESKILLSTKKLASNVDFNGEIVDLFNEDLFSGDSSSLKIINKSNDLAYVIYTSGTTGIPKGVAIEHRNIVNTIFWRKKYYDFNETDIILQIPSFSFDSAVEDILTALISGAKLVVINQDKRLDIRYLKETIINNNVTNFLVTPALYNVLLDDSLLGAKTLKKVTVAGENIQQELVKKHFKILRNVKLFNEYGPTENSVCSTTYEFNNKSSKVVIGKPIANTKVFILNESMNVVPIGVYGELCISGDGLARGYLNRPELTSEKFVENPFELGTQIYKTGDLVRWLPDGNIEFLGRIDHQVKIRGFRIELGEIETQMLNFSDIKEVVIIDRENKQGNKYLSAYFVSDNKVDLEILRGYLKEVLPRYMIPSYFIQLENLPLTVNGKVNRKELPEPIFSMNDITCEYEAPRNEIDQLLVDIWKEVLGVDIIGINDDFFKLGGESIKAIRIISKLKNKGYILDIKDLFDNPNIKYVSNYVSIDLKSELISQEEVIGQAGLTPIQKWFFNQNFKEMNHWNQSVMLYRKDGFEEGLVSKVFNKILKHHDALRMIFKNIDGEILQFNRENEENLFELKIFNYLDRMDFKDKIKKECEILQKSLDLWNGELIKLGLFKTSQGDYLAIIIHHLIIDGVSWRILFEDFGIAYEQALNKEEIIIQEKTNSYLDWQKDLEDYSYSRELLGEVDYWNEVLDIEANKLYVDKEINTEDKLVKNNEVINLTLDEEYTQNLLKNTNKAYNTNIDDILLTALALSINKWCENDKVIVNVESHGRKSIGETGLNINRTVGWFTAEYPVILKVGCDSDIRYNIKTIKETLRAIPNKGVGYNILKYYRHDIPIKKVNPEISFNYLGDFDNDSNNGVFEISELSIGSAVSNNSHTLYKFDINAGISNGTLIMAFEYNANEFKYESAKDFTDKYKECLYSLIDHCINKEEVDITPSDISNYNVSIEQLDMYKNSIEISVQEDEFFEEFEV